MCPNQKLCFAIAVLVVFVAQIIGFISSQWISGDCPFRWNMHKHMIVTMDLYNSGLDDIQQSYIDYNQTAGTFFEVSLNVSRLKSKLESNKIAVDAQEDVVEDPYGIFIRIEYQYHGLLTSMSIAQDKRVNLSSYEFDDFVMKLLGFSLIPEWMGDELKKVNEALNEYAKRRHVLEEFIEQHKEAALDSKEIVNLFESICGKMEQIKSNCEKLDLMLEGLSKKAEQLKATKWVQCSDAKRYYANESL